MVEEVEDYKYFGVVINKRLNWKSNTEAVYRGYAYFIYLGSSDLPAKKWGSSTNSSKDSNNSKLDKIIKNAGSIVGLRLLKLWWMGSSINCS